MWAPSLAARERYLKRYFKKLEKDIEKHEEFKDVKSEEDYKEFFQKIYDKKKPINAIEYKKFSYPTKGSEITFPFREDEDGGRESKVYGKAIYIDIDIIKPKAHRCLEKDFDSSKIPETATITGPDVGKIFLNLDSLERVFTFKNIIFEGYVIIAGGSSLLNLRFENCIFRKGLLCSKSYQSEDDPLSLYTSLSFKDCVFHTRPELHLKFNGASPSLGVATNLAFENCAYLSQRSDTIIIDCRKVKNAESALFKDCYFGKGIFAFDTNTFSKYLRFLHCTFDSFFNENAVIKQDTSNFELVFRGCKFLKGALRTGVEFYHKMNSYFVGKGDYIQAYEFYVLEERCKNLEIKDKIKGNLWQRSKGWIKYIFSWRSGYSFFSVYGSSTCRPFVFFLFVSSLASFLLYCCGEIKVNSEECPSFHHYLIATFGRLTKTFGAFSEIQPIGIGSETIVLIGNIFQSIFIVLFFIALRRRFKVGY